MLHIFHMNTWWKRISIARPPKNSYEQPTFTSDFFLKVLQMTYQISINFPSFLLDSTIFYGQITCETIQFDPLNFQCQRSWISWLFLGEVHENSTWNPRFAWVSDISCSRACTKAMVSETSCGASPCPTCLYICINYIL